MTYCSLHRSARGNALVEVGDAETEFHALSMGVSGVMRFANNNAFGFRQNLNDAGKRNCQESFQSLGNETFVEPQRRKERREKTA